MDDDSFGTPREVERSSTASATGFHSNLFFGETGLRAGWAPDPPAALSSTVCLDAPCVGMFMAWANLLMMAGTASCPGTPVPIGLAYT